MYSWSAMLDLKVTTGDGSTWEQRVLDDEVVVGRSVRAGLNIPDPALSRMHLKIYRSGANWFVEDLGSRNGTFLNSDRVTKPRRLDFGDVLAIGSSQVVPVPPRVQGIDVGGDLDLGSGHTVLRSAVDLLESGQVERSGQKNESAEVDAAIERLNLLNEVHRALGRSVELQELLDLILDRVFDHLEPEEGAVVLADNGSYRQAAVRSSSNERSTLVSKSLIREVVEGRQAALVLDAQSDERFNQAQSLVMSGVRSILAAPLLDGDDALGMIVLSSTKGVLAFDEEAMGLLVSLASVAAMRISNIRLAEEAAERRRLEQEVALGRRIQLALIPDELPSAEGWDLYARNLPSRGVSGDIYNIFKRNGSNHLVVFVADVSGKGIGASLLTASLEALSAAPLDAGMDLCATCRQVSRLLYNRTPPEKYATAFFAEIDTESGRMVYVNAGHNPGLLMHVGGTAEWLEASGVPLGLLPTAEYEVGQVELAPRDVVMLYTDGLTEAMDRSSSEYGEDRLREVALARRLDPLETLARAIAGDIDRFVGDEPYADDRTLVLVRRQPTTGSGPAGTGA
jgi:serine phosphatase RsbU (regulator of sigma subunit)